MKQKSINMLQSTLQSLLSAQKSKLLSTHNEPIKQKTVVEFVCVKCNTECSKQWKALKQKNDEITAYCKVCARIVAKQTFTETMKQKKNDKQKKMQHILSSIKDDSKERYCKVCDEIHPIEFFHHFQTGELVDKCKVVRLKKSKTNGNAQRKFTIDTLKDLLSKDKSLLIKIYYSNDFERVTTKTWIDIKCGKCGNIDKKRVDAIVRTGGYCAKCSNEKASVKKSESAIGKKRGPIVNRNEEAYQKKRKYSLSDIEDLLKEYGTVLVGGGYDERLSTKQTIQFICAMDWCFNVREKAIRDIQRGGCFCEECTEEERRDKISKLKSRPLQIVEDPTKEKICVECKWRKNIDRYVHDQSQDTETALCQQCRDKKKRRDLKRRLMLQLKEITDPETQQKCTHCYIIRDKNEEFTNDNDTCNMCRKHGNKGYKKTQERIKKFNNTHNEQKICVRCIYKYPTAQFKTPIQKKVGVLCDGCKEYIFNRNDELANYYLKLKLDGGGCVDCGLEDVRILEFDHIDRTQKLKCVGKCRSIEKMTEESKKCEMRCGICHRRRTKEQLNFGGGYVRPQKKFVDEQKIKMGGCLHCGWFDESLLEALEFDHLEKDDKISAISMMVINNIPTNLIDMEIQKCQLLCVHCHKLKTIEDNGYYLYKSQSRKKSRQERIKNIL